MSVASASPAAQWLNGVPIETSKFLFFIGSAEADLRAELSRRGWQGRVIAVAPPAFDGLDQLAATLEPDSEQPVVALEPAVMREHRDAVKQAARQIARTWFGARANQEAKQRNGVIYRTNTLRNARTLASEADAAVLRDAFADVPALVIGAGPSLDRNIADIAAQRDRALIIAADTALRPLLAAGIEPHIVVEADPSETNARHLCDLPPCSRTMLVAEGSVDSESLHAFAGRTFFFRVGDHEPWPWLIEHGLDCGKLRSWGSVLTTAFDLARTMGCSPIVFAGADLAFTNDRPYARGTTYEEIWYRAATWGQPLDSSWAASIGSWPETHDTGVAGARVRTAPHLRSFRDWIAAEAAKLAHGSVVNATGGGILIGDGLMQARLGEVLAAFDRLPEAIADRLRKCHQRGRRSAALSAAVLTASRQSWSNLGSAAARSATTIVTTDTLAPHEAEVILQSGDLLAHIETAWAGLGSANRLNLIDRTGIAGGSAVRRALFAFLESHPGLSARFGRFFDPNDERSWIDRRPVAELNQGEDRSKWHADHQGHAARLTPLFVDALQPGSVLDVGCGDGSWLRAFEAQGVKDVEGVEHELASYVPKRLFDLSLCLGIAHRVPMETAMAALRACATASDAVVFSVPAAAIGAPGFVNERPWSFWHRAFLELGLAPSDELRPRIEASFGRYQSPFDLAMVYRRIARVGERVNEGIAKVFLTNANRSDELVLDRHWQAHVAEAASVEGGGQPRIAYVDLELPRSRMESSETAGQRLFQYRSAAASLIRPLDGSGLTVLEDGNVVQASAHRGGIAFRASDDTDPRHNGRAYTLRLPAYIAFLEQLDLSTILEREL